MCCCGELCDHRVAMCRLICRFAFLVLPCRVAKPLVPAQHAVVTASSRVLFSSSLLSQPWQSAVFVCVGRGRRVRVRAHPPGLASAAPSFCWLHEEEKTELKPSSSCPCEMGGQKLKELPASSNPVEKLQEQEAAAAARSSCFADWGSNRAAFVSGPTIIPWVEESGREGAWGGLKQLKPTCLSWCRVCALLCSTGRAVGSLCVPFHPSVSSHSPPRVASVSLAVRCHRFEL